MISDGEERGKQSMSQNKIKIILWGMGSIANRTLNRMKCFPKNVDVIGFADNDSRKWTEDGNYPVFSPSRIRELDFDYIIIMSEDHFEEIRDMLIYWFHVDPSKVQRRIYLLKCMLIDKYSNSKDEEIQSILRYWEDHELSIYNQYVEEGREIHEVYWDYIENMPYIMFEDKKMYYPYDYTFTEIEGRKVIIDLMCEQQPSSPHLYIRDHIKVETGDVIADAGVCEGNFALRYVEKASKVYLFECSERWIKPLEKTFEKFRDKIVLCNKFLGRCDTDKYACLDSVVNERLDFLKMDIEGAEVEALIGGRNTLMNNHVKCAVCSYHRVNDELAISDILKSYGYKTGCSNGYMVFYLDEDIWSYPNFRRGIVYGEK